jgi:hypothetical protein
MNEPLLLLTLIDAWRHDRCTPEDTPFLHALQTQGASGALMEPFGFNTGPAIFAGIYPEISNQIQKFWYEPELSPFAFTRFIPEFLLHLPRGSGRLNTWIFRRAEAILRARDVTAAKHLVDFTGVPHRFRRFFNLVETKNHYEPGCVPATTVFDVLRSEGRSFLWIGVPDQQLTVESNMADFSRQFTGKEALAFIHWAETDWLGHEHGPDGAPYREKLRQIDASVANVFRTMQATGRPVRVLAFGDHGMASVVGKIDVVAHLASLSARCPEDYVYFLDSTAVRFWFQNTAARREVAECMSAVPHGNFLTEEDHVRYRLPKNDRRHWDLCWMLDEGYVVAPDFFHTDPARVVKGMHGYRPEVPANQAAWVVGGDTSFVSGTLSPRPMVDIAPTALALLGLDAPKSCQGAPLVTLV